MIANDLVGRLLRAGFTFTRTASDDIQFGYPSDWTEETEELSQLLIWSWCDVEDLVRMHLANALALEVA